MWSEKEIILLKEKYDGTYDVLESLFPGRTKRALKHKIGELGLRRGERRRWSEEELEVLRANGMMTPRQFVESGLLKRSEVQVAVKLREIRGTARRVIGDGLKCPSSELAYLLGALCSDGCMTKYGVEWFQSRGDVSFMDEVQRCGEKVWGLRAKRARYKKSCRRGDGGLFVGEYEYVRFNSRELLVNMATADGIACGNIRGSKGEWIEFIDGKFSWVFQDEWFWYFIGGLYDGDGTLKKKGLVPSIAVTPEKSAKRLVDEFGKRGFVVVWDSSSVIIHGGLLEYRRFTENVCSVLKRKKVSGVMEKLVDVADGECVELPWRVAKEFYEKTHYLGGVSSGVVTVGYVLGKKVVGVAAFGSAVKSESLKSVVVRELRRFALVENAGVEASRVLAACLRKYMSIRPDVDVVVTFADKAEGHKGTIYKATNAVFLGETGKAVRVVLPSGQELGGRYIAEMLVKKGVSLRDCSVKVVDGKLKFGYGLTGKGREVLSALGR